MFDRINGHFKIPGMFFNMLSTLLLVGILLVMASGCSQENGQVPEGADNTITTIDVSTSSDSETTTSSTVSDETRTLSLTLYFANDQADKLVGEVRQVQATTDAVLALAIGELMRGPKTAGLYPTIPKETRLLGIDLSDGLATVNFSKEFKEKHGGGSAGELMTVYSIIDTLTEFENVTAVKFLIEGEEIDTLAGHMDLTEPLKRDTEIIADPS